MDVEQIGKAMASTKKHLPVLPILLLSLKVAGPPYLFVKILS
jgi:hypothetical protein